MRLRALPTQGKYRVARCCRGDTDRDAAGGTLRITDHVDPQADLASRGAVAKLRYREVSSRVESRDVNFRMQLSETARARSPGTSFETMNSSKYRRTVNTAAALLVVVFESEGLSAAGPFPPEP